MELTPREENIAAAVFMHGYGMGHNDTVEGVWGGEDPETAIELITEHINDGGLLANVELIEKV